MAKAAAVRGLLDAAGACVVVDDPAQATRLHAKGNVGDMDGNRLRLRIIEAAWLASEGRLEVTGLAGVLSAAQLLQQGTTDARTEVGFLAYADLRSRGLLVRQWQGAWAVWPRGAAPEGDPEYVVEPHSERDAVGMHQVLAWAPARSVLALVDEDGAVTYYRAEGETPQGGCPLGDLPHVAGIALADRVILTDATALLYHSREHIGVPTGAGLVLSFTEAEALRRRGALEVPVDLAARASRVQPHFQRTLPVYEELRRAGVVAKSGFKFGTHLRGYRGNPDEGHAEWLIHCAIPDESVQWSELSRAIRLAHGVRKRFLMAIVADPIQFVRISWFRP